MTDRELMQQALETAEGIANADYRHWQELSSLAEFERWARSRSNHIAELLRARLAQCDRCGKVNPAEIHTCTPKKQEPGAVDSDKVICPLCCQQFRAIPVNVQKLMLAAGFEPPFTSPPPRESGCAECGKKASEGWALYCVECSKPMRDWIGLTDEEIRDAYGSVCGKEWCIGGMGNAEVFYDAIEAKLKEKNG